MHTRKVSLNHLKPIMTAIKLSRIALACVVFAVIGLSAAYAGISFDFVGQWGGTCNAMAVDGDHIYAGMGMSFIVLDVSNKTNPVPQAKLLLASTVNAIAVSGNIAYVATDDNQLNVIDISDPQNPVCVKQCSTNGSAKSIAISGGYAYVLVSSGYMRIFDLSTPTNPVQIGNYAASGSVYDVAISGNYAYLATGSTGLQVIDISDPANPTKVGGYDITNGGALGVVISSHYAYVAYGLAGLLIIDITNPATPVLTGLYNTSGSAHDVAVSNGIAYVADWSGMQIINVSNPTRPSIISSYITGGTTSRAFVLGQYLYAMDMERGISILDVSTPSTPVCISSYDLGCSIWDLAVSGSTAYLADAAQGLQIIDVSDASSPVRTAHCETGGSPWEITLSGKYACMATDGYGLQIIDTSNTTAPSKVGHWYQNQVRHLAAAGNYVFCDNGPSYMATIDILQPTNLTQVASTYLGRIVNRMKLRGNRLYVATDTDGLKVMDVTNPANPTEIAAYKKTFGTAYDIAFAGNYSYLALGNALVTIDESNPAAPVFSGPSNLGYISNIASCGNYIFAPNLSQTLTVIDVSNPTSPTLAMTYNPFNGTRVAVSNNYLYASGSSSGLFIYKINCTAWSSITGQVTDTYGNPIAGATVTTDSGGYVAITGADGRYAMPNVLPGRYSVTAAKLNMIPITTGVTLAESTPRILNFTLPAGGTISGFVKDNLGNPISGVKIVQYPYESLSDTNGYYELSTLPEGTYNLTASKSGWATVTSGPLPIISNQSLTYNFILQLGKITGIVRNTSGQLVSGATVSTSKGDYTATTGTTGTFTINNVAPGGYSITASKTGWLPVTNSISVTGAQTTSSNFILSAAGAITGVVKDNSGQPLAGVSISAAQGCYSYTASTDAAGTYSITSMQPASTPYNVIASKNGYAKVKKLATATAGQTTTCNFQLANAAALDLISSTNISTGVYSIWSTNKNAVVTSGNGLQILDMSDASHPVSLSTFGTASSAATYNNYVYIGSESAGLQILNMSNPSAPYLVGSCDTPGSALAINVLGNYVYIADGTSGLQIIDAVNPAYPQRVAEYDTPGVATGLCVVAGYAYVADAGGGLQIIDVRNPVFPAKVGTYSVPNCSFSDVAVSGNYAYIVDPYLNLFQVIDISTKSNPVLVGTGYLAPNCRPSKISLSGYMSGYCVYLACGAGGVSMYDISTPTDPGLVAQYTGCFANDIAFGYPNGLVYVADNNGNLVVLYTNFFKVTSYTPRRAANTESALTVALTGLGFDKNTTVKLTKGGQPEIVATGISFVDSTHIDCQLNLVGAMPGFWDVVVKSGCYPVATSIQAGFVVTLPSDAPCVAATNDCLNDAIITKALTRWQFKLVGKVTQTSLDRFWITDGSSLPVQVYARDYDHTRIVTGKYVAVTGTPDFPLGSTVILSSDAQIDVLK